MSKQLDDLTSQVNAANDDTKALQQEVQKLKLELATKDSSVTTGNDKALLEKVKTLEQKTGDLEVTLAEWMDLAKVSLFNVCSFYIVQH